MISVTKMQQGEVGEIQSLVPHNRPSSQYKIQTAAPSDWVQNAVWDQNLSLRWKHNIITLLSGWGLVIPFFSFVFSFFIIIFYPALRMGSSKTRFFLLLLLFFNHYYYFIFFGGHLPQTSGFYSAKQILVASFATQARACILSDHNIFNTPRRGRTIVGFNGPGTFLVFWWSLVPDSWFLLGQTNIRCKLPLP